MFEKPNYTQIPNDFFDSVMTELTDSELRVLLVIMRKTFGWSKEIDRISLTQLVELTGLARSGVAIGLYGRKDTNGVTSGGLIPKGIILVFESPKGNEYMVHVVDQQPVEVVHTVDQTSPRRGLEVVHTVDTQKKLSKETIQKKEEFPKDSLPVILATLLLTEHRKNDSNFLRDETKAKTSIQNWAKDIDKLIRLDKRTPEEIRRVIVWCQFPGCFWAPNILSGAKLRERFPTLVMQASAKTGPVHKTQMGFESFDPMREVPAEQRM